MPAPMMIHGALEAILMGRVGIVYLFFGSFDHRQPHSCSSGPTLFRSYHPAALPVSHRSAELLWDGHGLAAPPCGGDGTRREWSGSFSGVASLRVRFVRA